ncbi:MAG: alpha/beta hydrolase [Anaerolineales bacterium]|nr:alpha/beta hydrolase [Anaerolineales bacterium]
MTDPLPTPSDFDGPPDARTLHLPDDRRLGFAEYGRPAGWPVFGFFGASARRFRPNDAETTAAGVRLIVLERPGFGLSDPLPPRSLLAWTSDVAALADALGLARFAVIGSSQGGPYGAACAYALRPRVTALALVSALSSFEIPGVTQGMAAPLRLLPVLARRVPWLVTWMNQAAAGMARRDPERFFKQTFGALPAADQQAVQKNPEIKTSMLADVPEIYRQGSQGVNQAVQVACGPWGFRAEDIRVPTVVWQGEADPNVPPAMGRYLARAIPNAQAHFVPGAGHFLGFTHWAEILASLLRLAA